MKNLHPGDRVRYTAEAVQLRRRKFHQMRAANRVGTMVGLLQGDRAKVLWDRNKLPDYGIAIEHLELA